jgi:hypothetical protein
MGTLSASTESIGMNRVGELKKIGKIEKLQRAIHHRDA